VAFSFPYGTEDSFDNELIKSLKENEFSCSVSTIEGLNNWKTCKYKIRRIEIGNFSSIQLATHCSGLIGEFKTILKSILK
jgi:hypothetical protein